MGNSPILQAFKYVSIPVFTVASDGRISHSNAAANNLFGYSGERMTGQQITELLPVESITDLHNLIQPPATDANIKMIMGNSKIGKPLPLSVYMTSWSDELGLQHALVLRDISEDMKLHENTTDELKRANTAILAAKIGVFEFLPLGSRLVNL